MPTQKTTALEKSIQAQRPVLSRKPSAQEDEQNQAIQLLHALLGQRNENPSALNSNLLMSALPNAIGRIQNPEMQNQLLEYLAAQQTQNAPQNPVQQQSLQRGKHGMQQQVAQPQQQSASDWNEQQRQKNLEYNKTADLQNQLKKYQLNQQFDQTTKANQVANSVEASRQKFGELINPDAFAKMQQMMTVDGQQVPGSIVNVNKDRPSMENLGANFRSMSPSEQARYYAAGVVPTEVMDGEEGAKLLAANAKAIEEQHYGRVKVMGEEMAKGNITMKYDDKGNRVFTQWITDPNASPADIALGKGRKEMPLSPIQMHDILLGQQKGWLPDIDNILPPKGQQSSGPVQAPLTDAKNSIPSMFSDKGIPQNMDASLFSPNQTQSFTGSLLRDPEPANNVLANAANTASNIGQFAVKAVPGFLTGVRNTVGDVVNGMAGQQVIPPMKNPFPMDFSKPAIAPDTRPAWMDMQAAAAANNYRQGYPSPQPPEFKQTYREMMQNDPELWRKTKEAQTANMLQPPGDNILDTLKAAYGGN